MKNKIGNFDRTNSRLSKLEGCFTRWKTFKWSIFNNILSNSSNEKNVLDVGCGSLLETFYLSKKGFNVTSLDLNHDLLKQYYKKYNWKGIKKPLLTSENLESLLIKKSKFDLILTFDVIEHVEDLEFFLNQLHSLLKINGHIFVSVPNKFSITEIYAYILLKLYKIMRYQPALGVPHLHFYGTKGWKKKFQDANFEVVNWEYAIGPITNGFYFIIIMVIQNTLILMEIINFISRTKSITKIL